MKIVMTLTAPQSVLDEEGLTPAEVEREINELKEQAKEQLAKWPEGMSLTIEVVPD